MKLVTFVKFSFPSVFAMLALLALPLLTTLILSVVNCRPVLELQSTEQTGPFGASLVVTQRAKLDASGHAQRTCGFVGFDFYKNILGIRGSENREGLPQNQQSEGHNEFLNALSFTLLYVACTTPFVLLIGLLLALATQALGTRLKGFIIACALLPFIITPVVGALSIKWLFRDDGLVFNALSQMGIQIYWMSEAWSAQLLVIIYGIWHVSPFAFIVLYAGLQGVPQDSVEAARLDGASKLQVLRYVTLPHLLPLIVFITLIHLMDAYRVFEPILVLTQGVFTTSVQFLTYSILLDESNPYKASAASVLTLLGVALLLMPLLKRTWREQRHVN
jgi:multiple sugar transport system permease protein